jgi:diacylglycerol kinase (ATP)
MTPNRPHARSLRVDLIVNRTARRYARDAALLDRVVAEARRAQPACRVHVTGSLAELDEVAGTIAREGSDLVLLSGGDGSLMAGVSALARRYGGAAPPPIAAIPGGTAGTVARNWGVTGAPEACIARLFSRPRRIAHKPTLRIQDGTAERIGFIFGTGLVAKFFELYYERGAPGYSGSAQMVARIFVESFYGGQLARRVLEPLPCGLEVDGVRAAPSAWSLVCASVVPNLGIHMLVNYRAGEDPRRPHLVATPLPPGRLGPKAPLVLLGKPLGGPADVDQLVRSFAVTFPGRGPYVLDGELLSAARVEVSAGPEIAVALPA